MPRATTCRVPPLSVSLPRGRFSRVTLSLAEDPLASSGRDGGRQTEDIKKDGEGEKPVRGLDERDQVSSVKKEPLYGSI